MFELWKKIAGAHDWTSHQLREERNRQNEIPQRSRWFQNTPIDIEGVGKGMERVKGNADWKQNVEVRRLINDPDPRDKPLEVLKEKISVFEKAEHAQIHADARDQPSLLRVSILRFADLATEPEIHRRGGEKERGERWIPRSIKNVTRDHEQIFARIPAAHAPVESGYDYIEDDKGERIKKHGEKFGITLPMAVAHLRPPYRLMF